MKDFNGCRLGVYEKSLPAKLPFADRLLAARDEGYDFLEISIDETEERMSRLDWNSEKRLELLRAINLSGLPILTMCLSANRLYPIGAQNKEVREKGLELIGKAVDFSVDIGIRIVQVAGYDEFYNESNQTTRQLFYDSLKKAVEYASKNGVVLAIENVDTPFLDSIEKIALCAESLGSPYLQIYPDIGNHFAMGHTLLDETALKNKRIVGFHLKDTLPGIMREVPYGDGIVDFSGFFKQMIRLNFSGLYMAEMWATEDERASIACIAAAREFLAKKYAEAERKIEIAG
jgi:predicted hexulose-6-phosphate isomerase